MRIAVIGSRDVAAIDFALVGAEPGDVIVSGGARGADTLAAEAAREAGLEVRVHLPDYARHGRAATHIRNREIVADCDRLVAFWDGESKGTASTIAYAHRCGKPVQIFEVAANG